MTTPPVEEIRRRDMLPRWMRFVLVNERIPRAKACCTRCEAKIGRGYVRDPNTTRLYCDALCFGEHEQAEHTAHLLALSRISAANSWVLLQQSPRA